MLREDTWTIFDTKSSSSKKSTHYLNSRRSICNNLSLHPEDTSNLIEHSPRRTNERVDIHSLDEAPSLRQNDEHSNSMSFMKDDNFFNNK